LNSDTQIVKGILEGCILKIFEKEETYGYKTVERLNNIGFDVNEATVYPILARLQNKGLLRINRKPSPFGPTRKYYSLTEAGTESLNGFRSTWNRINNIVNKLMEDDVYDWEK
jgi:PadR family transcriptional regulator, regulatory protein PadR